MPGPGPVGVRHLLDVVDELADRDAEGLREPVRRSHGDRLSRLDPLVPPPREAESAHVFLRKAPLVAQSCDTPAKALAETLVSCVLRTRPTHGPLLTEHGQKGPRPNKVVLCSARVKPAHESKTGSPRCAVDASIPPWGTRVGDA